MILQVQKMPGKINALKSQNYDLASRKGFSLFKVLSGNSVLLSGDFFLTWWKLASIKITLNKCTISKKIQGMHINRSPVFDTFTPIF